MLKRMTPERVEACLVDAADSRMQAAGTTYPEWYLHRWHFLPEGYLSRRSAALYDAVVRRIYNVAAESTLHEALGRALRRQQPKTVLEIGCGPGNALAAMRVALPEARLIGVDLSPFLLEMADDRLPPGSVDLVHADATVLPEGDEAVDAVISQHMLGHLPREAARSAWREAIRVLRPGGRLYFLEHAWHPRRRVSLQRVSSRRLLGGIVRLDVFEKAAASGS